MRSIRAERKDRDRPISRRYPRSDKKEKQSITLRPSQRPPRHLKDWGKKTDSPGRKEGRGAAPRRGGRRCRSVRCFQRAERHAERGKRETGEGRDGEEKGEKLSFQINQRRGVFGRKQRSPICHRSHSSPRRPPFTYRAASTDGARRSEARAKEGGRGGGDHFLAERKGRRKQQ